MHTKKWRLSSQSFESWQNLRNYHVPNLAFMFPGFFESSNKPSPGQKSAQFSRPQSTDLPRVAKNINPFPASPEGSNPAVRTIWTLRLKKLSETTTRPSQNTRRLHFIKTENLILRSSTPLQPRVGQRQWKLVLGRPPPSKWVLKLQVKL